MKLATKKQLIDARALMEYARNQKSGTIDCNDIARFPTVDAVEVVRCKDCRFCKKHPTSDKTKICTNERWNTEYHPFAYDEGFCSYGERRTDNEKS